MVAPLKLKGVAELSSFKNRVQRSASLNRIAQSDADRLVKMTNELINDVAHVRELPDLEEEFL